MTHLTRPPIFALFALLCFVEPALAQRDLGVGMRLQKNAAVQPGIEISYSHSALLNGRPRVALSYLTSRLSTAFDGNRLAEDRILLSGSWIFRPAKPWGPYVELEVGYTRFDRENQELFALLDNDAFIASVLVGLEVRLFDSGFSFAGDAGYSVLHSSTVYPLVTSLGIRYALQPRNTP